MTVRAVVWWKCFLSLSVVFSYRAANSLSTFPMFRETFHWDRLDQGNLFSAEAWGILIACFFGTFVIRSIGSKYIIIAAHLWQAYFSLFCVFMDYSYYDIWANKFFSSMADGIIFIAVFHMLLFWLPSNEILSRFYLISCSLSVGFISGTIIAWYFATYFSWHITYTVMACISIVSAWQWYSASVSSYPQQNTKISTAEQNFIQSNRHKFNRKDLKIFWFAMLCNTETIRFGISAFAYGYVILGLQSFHNVLFMEATSLQSNIQELPLSTTYAWIGWILASVMIGGGISFNICIPGFNKIQVFYGSKSILLIEGIFSILCAMLLRSLPTHPEIFWLNIRLFLIFYFLAIVLTSFIISHIHCENSEPELLLAWSVFWMCLGGVISNVLGGLILEMSGAWSIMFRYQSNLLILAAILCNFLPWIFCYLYRKKKKRTISAQHIDIAL